MLLNRIQPSIATVLRRNQNGFRQGRSAGGQILTISRIIEGVCANAKGCFVVCRFFKGKDETDSDSLQNSKRNSLRHNDAV